MQLLTFTPGCTTAPSRVGDSQPTSPRAPPYERNLREGFSLSALSWSPTTGTRIERSREKLMQGQNQVASTCGLILISWLWLGLQCVCSCFQASPHDHPLGCQPIGNRTKSHLPHPFAPINTHPFPHQNTCPVVVFYSTVDVVL